MRRLLGGCFRKRAAYRRRHRLHHFFAQNVVPRRLRVCHPVFTFLGRRGQRDGATIPRIPGASIPLHHHLLCVFDKVTTKVLLVLNVTNLGQRFGASATGCMVVSKGYCASTGLMHRRTVVTFHSIDVDRRRMFTALFSRWGGGVVGRAGCRWDRSRRVSCPTACYHLQRNGDAAKAAGDFHVPRVQWAGEDSCNETIRQGTKGLPSSSLWGPYLWEH